MYGCFLSMKGVIISMFESMAKYHIFISHAWKYSDDYNTVSNWIKESGLPIKNYSVPEHDPLDANNKAKLKSQLTEQIKHASIVIIIGGMYGAYSDWMNYEFEEAKRMNKKIILIKPWGQERIPMSAQVIADDVIGWNSTSLINSIKNK